jgi:hypothetical protein
MTNINWHDVAAVWFIGGIVHSIYLGAVRKMEGDFLTVFFMWFVLWPIALLFRWFARVFYFFKNLRHASNNKNNSSGD